MSAKKIEEIKVKLLRETNYRCGYCMKNITPKMYYIDANPTNPSGPIFDYIYRKVYNVHDRAHIEPNSEAEDDFKDFYNLITLCKQCHWEIDKPKMLSEKELKKQKLYWMTSSGQFSRLEIDLLMQLPLIEKMIFSGEELSKLGINEVDNLKNIINTKDEAKKDIENLESLKINSAEDAENIAKYINFLDKHSNLINISIALECVKKEPNWRKFYDITKDDNEKCFIFVPNSVGFLIRNLIDNNLVTVEKYQKNFERVLLLKITEKGIEFCEKFKDVYKEI